MKLKSIISFVLVLTMVVLTVSAATFPDVEPRHSWAQDAIDNMSELGILKGFPDGNFQPDTPISKQDSLLIASRILGYSNPENIDYIDSATSKYEDVLKLYDFNYKSEVSYLLYKNILKTNELSTYISEVNKGKELKRYEAAIILTKLMGGEAGVESYTKDFLSYDDVDRIPENAIPYVAFVTDMGIMNGMSETEFNPSGSVTRAMMATMMYRAMNKMNIKTVDATVVSSDISNSAVNVEYADGTKESIIIPSYAAIKLDATDSKIASLSSGLKIKLTYYNDSLVFIEGLASNLTMLVSGIVKASSSANGVKMISIYEPGDTEQNQLTYPLTATCDFRVNNKSASLNDIKAGTYVTLTVKGGSVTLISAETESASFKGKITDISLGETAIITIEKTDGTESKYSFSNNATLKRNGESADTIDLAVGDSVSYTVLRGVITTLTATGISKQVTGTIEEIVISSTPSIKIKLKSSSEVYNVNGNTTFEVDGEKSTIYDLRLGATATVSLDGKNIKNISTAALIISNVLVGTISYIHPTSNVMGVDVVNSDGEITTVQTVVKSTVTITDVTSTRISSFKKLTTGRSVVVTGSVNYGVFEVSTITITE